MSERARVPFDPGGTARALSGLARGIDTEPPFPRSLAARLARTELGAGSLSLAWELARLARGDDAALLVLVLLVDATRTGSTALDLGSRGRILSRARLLGLEELELSRLSEGLARVESGALLSDIVGASSDRRPLVRTGSQLALARHVALEERLARRLALRTRTNDPRVAVLDDAPLATIRGPVSLTDEQRAAVRAAIAGKQLVIAGGPGTGKTSIVAAIVRALAGGSSPSVPPSAVALAAPTGKAADRLFSALSMTLAHEQTSGGGLLDALAPATTLHRLLGYRAFDGAFTFHAENPLPQRLVVVDEASMLDLALAERLVSALAPSARLVLLGDPDQLPSVDAGAVLGDLVSIAESAADPIVPVVRLTKSHRMDASDASGAQILGVAARVRKGEALRIGRLGTATEAAAHASGVALFSPSAEEREVFLRAYFARVFAPLLDEARAAFDPTDDAAHARVHRLFGALGRARLLTVTRGVARPTGADAVNGALARELHGPRAGWAFSPGEPLLAVRNDYDRELMNGDQGLVMSAPSGELLGVFLRAGRVVTHPLADVRGTVERAYATTVHKAQGSEHDHVALLLPETKMPTLSRELVYTAITRARTSALIVGDESVLDEAVKEVTQRTTGLRTAIATELSHSE